MGEEKGCMGRLRASRLACGVAVGWLLVLGGCGGHTSVPTSPVPARVTLNPGGATSVQLGNTVRFSASAVNSSNSNINVAFTFQSSDTSILNFAPGGQACAGRFDPTFISCIPAGSGAVQVTATADGVVSPPTLVFVHPPIDNIVVTQVPPSPPYVTPVPCISQGQTMTLQATAYSQGVDVTPSVGPFTWSVANPSVVTVTPIVTNLNYGVATNQATATAAVPGFTQIFANATNVSSSAFQQFTNNNGPVWNFFETCPVQTITLQLGSAGSQQSGQTIFVTSKGKSQAVTAIVYDVIGNLVAKPSLTWTSSQPAAVSAPASCTTSLTCTVNTAGPGAGIVTASCTPPSCNVGFPLIPENLPASTAALYIPVPVYAATAISGLVNGAVSGTGVIASSLDCTSNFNCSVALYDVSTSANLPGNPLIVPTPPNSLAFDAAGDKGFVGSNFGAFTINPSNIGTASSPFGGLGTITGKILAVSLNGQLAIFSDTVHAPNQVYIVNTVNASSPSISEFAISGAVAAAFSPDNLKAYIVACVPGPVACSGSTGNTVFVYSTLQSMQTIPLTAPASAVAFSSTGAFAFVTGGSTTSLVTAFNTCNNALSTDKNGVPLVINNPLPEVPSFLQVLPAAGAPPPVVQVLLYPVPNATGLDVLIALDHTGIDLIATDATVLGSGQPPIPGPSCPQYIEQAVNLSPTPPNPSFPPQHIDFGLGTFHPISFFVSPDGSKAYVVTTDFSSILVFDFNTGSLSSSIPLHGNAIPVSASFTVDGTLLYVAANDGTLHLVNTLSAADVQQISFPNLPDVNNPYCQYGATTIDCNLNLVVVKP
jgi:WD40 repeat protein